MQCVENYINEMHVCILHFCLVYLGSVLTVARYQEHVPPRPEEGLPSTESWSLKGEHLQCWLILETLWLDNIQIISNIQNILLLSVQYWKHIIWMFQWCSDLNPVCSKGSFFISRLISSGWSWWLFTATLPPPHNKNDLQEQFHLYLCPNLCSVVLYQK